MTDKVTLEELMMSTLGMTDALAKLMIAKGIITDEKFKTQLSTERANYVAVLKRMWSMGSSLDQTAVWAFCRPSAVEPPRKARDAPDGVAMELSGSAKKSCRIRKSNAAAPLSPFRDPSAQSI